jgi:RNA polymerase sigma-70 factor (ECF subfamily)
MSVSLEARRDASGLEPADLNPSTEPSFGLDVSDRQRLVQQALGELSEEFREAIVLKEIEQMSYEEIAEVVGIPLGTVRSRIHRARMELRQKLAAFIEAEVI